MMNCLAISMLGCVGLCTTVNNVDVDLQDLVCFRRDLVCVKRDLVCVKRDLLCVKRDLVCVKRDLVCVNVDVDLHAPSRYSHRSTQRVSVYK